MNRIQLFCICLLVLLSEAASADCPVPCVDCTLQKGQLSQSYSFRLYGRDIGQYSVVTGIEGTVPPGLSLVIMQSPSGNGRRPNMLALYGTPTQIGNYVFSYKFEDRTVNEAIEYIPGYGNYITQKIQITCVTAASTWPLATIAVVPVPLDDDLLVVIPVEKNIPRDPGPMGDATVAGIDSNGNGLRDDVERGIVYAYPNNRSVQVALFEMAKSYQSLLTNSGSTTAVRQNFSYIAGWGSCVEAATGDIGVEGSLFRPLMLNTYDRSLAYIAALRSLQGTVTIPSVPIACP